MFKQKSILSRAIIWVLMPLLVLSGMPVRAHAADIQAVLDSDDGSSKFVFQDSNASTVASIDSNGNLVVNGTARIEGALTLDANDIATYDANPSFTLDDQIISKKYVDDQIGIISTQYDDIADPNDSSNLNFTTFSNTWTATTISTTFFKIDQTGNATGGDVAEFAADDAQITALLRLDNEGAVTLADGLIVEASNASGVLTDAIDVSDAEIIHAINVGANIITGTTAELNFTNFKVDTAGNITNVNTITAAGNIVVSGTAFIDGVLTLDANDIAVYDANPTFTADAQIVTKKYVDDTVGVISTKYNDITDPDASSTLNFAAFANTWSIGAMATTFFKIDQTGNATGGDLVEFESGDTDVTALLRLDNDGAGVTMADALVIEASSTGVLTDAIDVSDAEIINAINVGANIITGSTAEINFTNFDVSSGGGVTFTGVDADITTGTNEHLALMPNGAGLVGVGTTAPGAKLDVFRSGSVSTDYPFRVQGSGGIIEAVIESVTSNNADLVIRRNSGTDSSFILRALADGVFDIYDGQDGVTRLQIDTSGNIGIGTTVPAAQLEVQVADTDNVPGILIDNNDTTNDTAGLMISMVDQSGIPLFITPQANQPSVSTEGAVYSDTDNNLYYYDGTGWLDLTSGVGAATSLIGLSDVNTATATAGFMLIADGTDYESVAISGDMTIAGDGTATVTDDILDFTEFANTMTLDESSSINFGANTLTFNLSSTGDFVIEDGGVATHIFDSDGNVGIGTTVPQQKLDVNGSILTGSKGHLFLTGNIIVLQDQTYTTENSDPKIFFESSGQQNSLTYDKFTAPYADTRLFIFDDSLAVSGDLYATGNVGIGTVFPASQLEVQVADTDNVPGILIDNNDTTNDTAGLMISMADQSGIPLFLTPQANQPSVSTEGAIYADTDDNLYYYDGTNWVDLTAGAGAATSLTGLTDVNTATATAGFMLIADGTDWESMAVSGDMTIAGDGIATITDDILDFTEFANTMTLDESSSINFGANTLTFNLSSTGDFVIQDGGVATHIFDSDGNVGIGTTTPTALLTVGKGNDGFPGGQVHFQPGLVSNANVDLKMYRWNGVTSHWPAYMRLTNGNVQFLTGSPAEIGSETVTEKITILNAGNVGIGTTAPTALLETFGTSTTEDFRVTNADSGTDGVSLSLHHDSSSPANSDTVATIDFAGEDSGGIEVGYARISTIINTFTGDEAGEMIFSVAQAGNMTEAMRIDENGYVGIGTATPDDKFVVNDSSDYDVNFKINGTNELEFRLRTSGQDMVFGNWAAIYSNSIPSVLFKGSSGSSIYDGLTVGDNYVATTPPSQGMVIEGNVGIGTISVSSKFEVKVADTDNVPGILIDNNDTTNDTAGLMISMVDQSGIPLFITPQANQPSVSTEGALYADTDDNLYYYDGTNWVDLTASAGATSLTGLTDVNTATATAGFMLIADGSDWESMAVSGDMTIAGDGTATITDDILDFTEFANTMTLDETTSINFGANTLTFNLSSTGDFVIQDGGVATHIFDSDGNVGIGTTVPDGTLHVHTNTAGSVAAGLSQDDIIIENSTDVGLTFLSPDATVQRIVFGDASDNNIGILRYSHNGDFMAFRTNTSEQMRIDSSGNVGIGTTTPTAKLEVLDSGTSEDFTVINTDAGTDGVSLTLHHDSASPANNDTIATIDFAGEDSGGVEVDYARISTSINTFTGDEAGELIFSVAQAGNMIEAMRVDENGYVGVGTTAPAVTLDVWGASGTDGTIRAHSGDHTQTSDYIEAYHNQTDAIVESASGALRLRATTGVLRTFGQSTIFDDDFGSFNFHHDDENMLQIILNRTNDEIKFGVLDGGGNQLILTNSSNAGNDHDHAVQTDPTFYIHSDTDPDTDNTQWLSFAHTKTNAIFGLGTGAYIFQDGNVGIGTTSVSAKLEVEVADTDNVPGILIDNNDTTNDTAGLMISMVDQSGIPLFITPQTNEPSVSTEGAIYADTDDNLYYYDGTSWVDLTAGGTATLQDADTDTKIQVEETGDEDKIHFDTAGSERMIIDDSGLVGIGTDVPSGVLHVAESGGVGAPQFVIERLNHASQNNRWDHVITTSAGSNGSLFVRPSLVAANIGWSTTTGNTPKMMIDTSGNIGIGTTSPTALLETFGTSTTEDFRITNTEASDDGVTITLHHDSVSPANSDTVATIDFAGEDSGGAEVDYARISTIINTFTGDEAGEMIFSVAKAGSLTEAMRIDENGYVGIGTTTPRGDLDVVGQIFISDGSSSAPAIEVANFTDTGFWVRDLGSGQGALNFESQSTGGNSIAEWRSSGTRVAYLTGSGALVIDNTMKVDVSAALTRASYNFVSDSDTGIGGDEANKLSLITGGTIGVVVDSVQNVGIGTTNPVAHLEVKVADTDNVPGILIDNNDTTNDTAGLMISMVDQSGIPLFITPQANQPSVSTEGALYADTDDNLYYYDGTNWVDLTAGGSTTLQDADTNTKIQVEESANEDKIRFDTAGSERMIITDTGLVGIGTTAPGNMLHLKTSANAMMQLENTTSQDADILYTSGSESWQVGADSSKFFWYSDAVFRMVIDTNGNVGIGTTSPTALLETFGTSTTEDFRITNTEASADGVAMTLHHDSSSPAMNDTLAIIDFTGEDDGSTETDFARISALANTVTDTIESGELVFSVTTGGSLTEAMRIDESGNVGIGTLVPSQKLEVYGGSIIIKDNSNSLYYGNESSFDTYNTKRTDSSAGLSLESRHNTSSQITFETGSTPSEVMRITHGGNVGIGTNTPAANLEVFSTGSSEDFTVINTDAGVDGVSMTLHHDSTSPDRNDTVATIDFTGEDDGSVETDFARISALANTVTDAIESGELIFSVTTGGSLAEAMRIDESGNMGIGVTAPSQALEVNGNIQLGAQLRLGGSSVNDYFERDPSTGDINIYEDGNLVMSWRNQKVGISLADPNATLHVEVDNGSNVPGILIDNNDTTNDTAGLMISMVDQSGIPLFITPQANQPSVSTEGALYADTDDNLYYYDGTNWVDLTAGGSTTLQDADTDTKIQVEATGDEDKIRFDTAGSERMIITDTGLVGIGTTAPAEELEIEGADDIYTLVQSTGANSDAGIKFRNDAVEWFIKSWGGSGDKLLFYDNTNNDERITITPLGELVLNNNGIDADFRVEASGASEALFVEGSSGNVGIGTTSPTALLEIFGTATTEDFRITNTEASADGVAMTLHHDSASPANSDTVATIDFAGEDSGGAEVDYARISTIINTFTGDEAGEMIFSVAKAGTLTEAMRIDENGYVGIGTVTPSNVLTIQGVTTILSPNGTKSATFTVGDSWDFRIANSVGDLILAPSGGDVIPTSDNGYNLGRSGSRWKNLLMAGVLNVDSVGDSYIVGNVGVGTTSPRAHLEVQVADTDNVPGILIDNNDTTNDTAGLMISMVDQSGIPLFITPQANQPSVSTEGAIYADTDDNLYYYDGTNWVDLTAGASGDLQDTDGDTKVQVEETGDEDKIRFDTAGSERMIIDDSGLVGIGTTAPTDLVTILNGDVLLKEDDGGSQAVRLSANNFAGAITVYGSTAPAIYLGGNTGSSEKSYFNAGNVGIGTTSPTSLFETFGTSTTEDFRVTNTDSGTDGVSLSLHHDSSSPANSDTVATIDFSGEDSGDVEVDYARISTIINTFTGDEAGEMIFSVAQAGNMTEAMRIDENGYVGVGTTGPAYKLDVQGSDSNIVARIQNASNNGAILQLKATGDNSTMTFQSDHIYGSNGLHLGNGENIYVRTDVGGTVGIGYFSSVTGGVLAVNGNVGIGTITPVAHLEIQVADTDNVPGILIDNNDTTNDTAGLMISMVDQSGIPLFITPQANQPSVSTEGALYADTDDNLYYYDGTNWVDLTAGGSTTLQDADTNTKIQVEESANEDKIRFDTAGTERMIIDDSGLVGIGTALPGEILSIRSAATASLLGLGSVGQPTFTFKNNVTSGDILTLDMTAGKIFSVRDSNNSLRFASFYGNGSSSGLILSGTDLGADVPSATLEVVDDFMVSSSSSGDGDRFIVNSSGLVGIGTTVPTALLEAFGTSTTEDFRVTNTDSGTDGVSLNLHHDSISPANSDTVATIGFAGEDSGGAEVDYARISTIINTFTGDEAGELIFSVAQAGAMTEAMRIDENGYVGIGTTGPVTNLQLNQTSTNSAFRIYGNATFPSTYMDLFINQYGQLTIGGSSGDVLKLANSPLIVNDIDFKIGSDHDYGIKYSGASTQLQLSSTDVDGVGTNGVVFFVNDGTNDVIFNGNVGIGTTAPAGHLEVEVADGDNVPGILIDNNDTTNDTAGLMISMVDQSGIPLFITPQANQPSVSTEGALYADTDDNLYYYDGTNWVDLTAGGSTTLQDADTNTKIQVEESANEDKIRFDTAGAERMIITDTGLVGIGTTAPLSTLQVGAGTVSPAHAGGSYGSGTQDLSVNKVSGEASLGVMISDAVQNRRLKLFLDDTNGITGIRQEATSGSMPFVYNVGGGELLRITTAGHIGIGTSVPTALLETFGTSTTEDFRITNTEDSADGVAMTLHHDSASPAMNDTIATIDFTGENSSSTATDFARISTLANTVTAGLESGELIFSVTTGGSLTEAMRIDENGYIGIGTTAPRGNLDVVGQIIISDGSTSTPAIEVANFPDTGIWVRDLGSGQGALNFESKSTGGNSITEWRSSGTRVAYLSGGGNLIAIGNMAVDNAATLTRASYGLSQDTDTGMGGDEANKLALVTGGATGLVIDSFQNVGIGTITPVAHLEIQVSDSDNVPGILIDNNDTTNDTAGLMISMVDQSGIPLFITPQTNQPSVSTEGALYADTDDNLYYYDGTTWVDLTAGGGGSLADADSNTKIQVEETANEDKIHFDTGGAERMVIDDNGFVGIGTVTPGAALEVDGTMALSPSSTTDITAGGGVTVTNGIQRLQGSGGGVDITVDPQIADGIDGQIVIFKGQSNTNTVKFDDGNGLQLGGGVSFTMGQYDTLMMMYDADDDMWVEVSRSDN